MSADTAAFDLGGAVVTVTTGAGPRILGYGRTEEESLFAILPDAVIEHPAVGRFRFMGGHRLWRAPEDPAVTYQPDVEGATVQPIERGVVLTGAADGDGIVREITLRRRGEAAVVDHVLHNAGPAPVEAAPWAITQLTIGGTAFLPQAIAPADPDRVRPNRHLVLWPYTDLAAREVSFAADTIRVEASPSPAKLKLGWPNIRGWLAYALGGRLFVKWARPHDDRAVYTDFGASAQCYRDARFLELETLGPLTTIAPGGTAAHREVWELFDLGVGGVEAIIADLPATHPELGR